MKKKLCLSLILIVFTVFSTACGESLEDELKAKAKKFIACINGENPESIREYCTDGYGDTAAMVVDKIQGIIDRDGFKGYTFEASGYKLIEEGENTATLSYQTIMTMPLIGSDIRDEKMFFVKENGEWLINGIE